MMSRQVHSHVLRAGNPPVRGESARRVQCAERGFTLIELIVTVAIAGILLSVALPNLSSFTAEMRAKNTAFEFVGDIMTARSEALKRNEAVLIQAKSASWANGWQVVSSSSAEVIRDRKALPSGMTLTPTNAATAVTFDPTGQVNGLTSTLKFEIAASDSSARPRCIVMTPTGSARTKSGVC